MGHYGSALHSAWQPVVLIGNSQIDSTQQFTNF